MLPEDSSVTNLQDPHACDMGNYESIDFDNMSFKLKIVAHNESEFSEEIGERACLLVSANSSTSARILSDLNKKYPEDSKELLDELTELTKKFRGRALNPFLKKY